MKLYLGLKTYDRFKQKQNTNTNYFQADFGNQFLFIRSIFLDKIQCQEGKQDGKIWGKGTDNSSVEGKGGGGGITESSGECPLSFF